MHNNYYFLRQLSKELNSELVGCKLVDAYSQVKDEAILRFRKNNTDFTLVAHLTGQFTCLAFPEEHSKARKNTASIFSELIGSEVKLIDTYVNERAFFIEFENEFKIIIKLFGRQANLILSKSNEIVNLFRKGFKSDYDIKETDLNRKIDQSVKAIIDTFPDFRSVFPTLNKDMLNLINTRIEGLSADKAAKVIKESIFQYENPIGYLIREQATSLKLEIALDEDASELLKSPKEVITSFFYNSLAKRNYHQTKTRLLAAVDKKIGKTEVYLSKTSRKLSSIEKETNYREMADIIMANMHLIKSNIDSVELDNFYSNSKIEIRLKPTLNAQQNAERYYRKAKNLTLEIDNLKKSIQLKSRLLDQLKLEKLEIEQSESGKELKRFTKTEIVKSKTKTVPFKEFIIGGYTIYVGNNAKQNDLLTLKYAKKDDLFFHAKDVSGSHVILKHKSGSNVPKKVLEATASLAAYYSKRKTDTLCPVGYTEKKYVRKPKGSPAGLVLVEREKVLLVPPGLP